MGSQKPHAVCIPFPAQGHITPMLKLAKLLHHRGFHITFVNSEFNHRRLLKSQDRNSLDSLTSFRFESIPDGLPPPDIEATQDIPTLCKSTSKLCLPYLKDLLYKLHDSSTSSGVPPVTCLVSDGVMSFTLEAAEELGVPQVLLWTTSACGMLGYMQYPRLTDEGYTPLKDSSFLTNGYLDTIIDWIPGMKNIRLRDLPSFVRSTDPNEFMLEFFLVECERTRRASAIILNTFDALEHDVLNALKKLCPPIFTIGSLQHLLKHAEDPTLDKIGSSMWKEEPKCLEWLNMKDPQSVVYVNFGSITVMTSDQLIEFAWGLANSGHTFLWIIRPDLVTGDSPCMLPQEFLSTTKERSMLASWCPQEQVLKHPAINGFLTHGGWNSTLESICAGVPMVCWPFFAEQPMNCRYCCKEWGIGMEINSDVKRDEVEMQVRELMEGEKGKEMKKRAKEWKKLAEDATSPSGRSYLNLDEMINKVLLRSSSMEYSIEKTT